MRRALLDYFSRLTLTLGALPLLALFQLVGRRSFWSQIPPRLQEELQGVAAGAQVGLSLVVLINVIDDLANNWPACSALAVGEGRTSRGSFLAGRTLDYPVFVDVLVDLQTLLVMSPDEGVPLVSLAWPGYVGVLTGMNRAGLALVQLTAMCRDHTLKGLPAGLRNRLALEQHTTIPDAIVSMTTVNRTIGNNELLVGPGEACVLELSARKYARRRPVDGLITVTNHFQSAAMASVKGRFPRRPPLSVLSPHHFTEAYSQARNTRLQELAAGKTLGPAEVQTCLADPGVANPGTVSAVVFDPAARALWVAQKGPPPVSQGQFVKYTFWEAGA
jgi:predicted choloylglycine hydrolase